MKENAGQAQGRKRSVASIIVTVLSILVLAADVIGLGYFAFWVLLVKKDCLSDPNLNVSALPGLLRLVASTPFLLILAAFIVMIGLLITKEVLLQSKVLKLVLNILAAYGVFVFVGYFLVQLMYYAVGAGLSECHP